MTTESYQKKYEKYTFPFPVDLYQPPEEERLANLFCIGAFPITSYELKDWKE